MEPARRCQLVERIGGLVYHDPSSARNTSTERPAMKITLEQARRIAHLAYLRFESDAELDRLRGHLEQILGYIDKLGELDTEGVEPAVGPAGGLIGSLREDSLLPTLSEEEVVANAPESGRGHFKVPRIIA